MSSSFIRFFRRTLSIALVTILSLASAAAAATASKKLSLVFADFSERAGLLFVAKDQHFFEEQGLDMDVVQVRNGPVAIAAVAAGEAQFYSVSATGASLGAMAVASTLFLSRGLSIGWMAISPYRRRFAPRRI